MECSVTNEARETLFAFGVVAIIAFVIAMLIFQ